MSSVANQGLQASTSNPELVGRFKLENLPATSEIQEINDNPMNAPANANRASSIETSIPLDDDLISQIIDLLSLVGRKRDVVSVKANETRFRAYLSSGDSSRLESSQEPRIEGLLGIKSSSKIQKNRLKIRSLLAELRTKMNDLSVNQATIDLLKEDLPEEGVAILNSLHLSNSGEDRLNPEEPDLSANFESIKWGGGSTCMMSSIRFSVNTLLFVSFLNKPLASTNWVVVSVLYFDSTKIVIAMVVPKNKFGAREITVSTKLLSTRYLRIFCSASVKNTGDRRFSQCLPWQILKFLI